MKFDKSRELYARARQSLAGGVSSQVRIREKPVPLYFERGKGARLFDVDGNEYIDYVMGRGPTLFGHSPDFLLEAVIQAMQRGQMFGGQHELEVTVSELMQKVIPCAELVRFSSSGTEAVQAALRLARAYTGRNKFIKFEGHYHGWMDSVMYSTFPSLDRVGPRDHPSAVPMSAGQARNAVQEVIVLPWNDLEVLRKAVEQEGDDVAAILMEPIMCNTNCAMPRPGYLEGVRKLCDERSMVLIFDEVITGFRVALGGAQGYFGVTPDMATFAKGLAGGFPLSMLAGKRQVMQSLEDSTTTHGGTANSNVMVMAAAEACVNKLMEQDGAAYKHLYGMGTKLMEGLGELAAKYEHDVLFQGLPPVFQMDFTSEKELPDYRAHRRYADIAKYARFRQELLERGVRVLDLGRWFLSTAHMDEDIEKTLAAAEGALAAIRSKPNAVASS